MDNQVPGANTSNQVPVLKKSYAPATRPKAMPASPSSVPKLKTKPTK